MTLSPSFLTGFAVSGALIVAIGAQNAFVLRQGLRREHVGPIVAFCACSDILLIAAGVAGIGAALGHLPGLAVALTLCGALFLLAYGGRSLGHALHPSAGLAADGKGTASPLGAVMLRTAGFTLLNPHVYLDTVLVVGAVGAAQPAGGQTAFVAGAGLASTLWFLALGYGARLLTPFFARPAAWRVLDALVGATMLALAAGLVSHSLA